jgi:hypothetical protein
MWHDIDTKFHKEWSRHYKVVRGEYGTGIVQLV